MLSDVLCRAVKRLWLVKLLSGVLCRAVKRLWLVKLRPCLKKRCSRKVNDRVAEGPKPKPNEWDIEYNKPEMGDFTLAEYTEKVILYGFVMVNHHWQGTTHGHSQ